MNVAGSLNRLKPEKPNPAIRLAKQPENKQK